MRALQPSDETEVVSTTRRARRRSRVGRPIAALTLASAMVLGSSAVAANAIDVPYPPGPTVVADPNSPTGYTGHFVYCNPDATSVRFVADIMLRNWADRDGHEGLLAVRVQAGPDARRRRVRRGDDERRRQLLVHERAAGRRRQPVLVLRQQQHERVAGRPANSPIFAPDGIGFPSRRAFNKVFVPYDAAKQNFAPLAARQIELPREDSVKGTWSYVELRV